LPEGHPVGLTFGNKGNPTVVGWYYVMSMQITKHAIMSCVEDQGTILLGQWQHSTGPEVTQPVGVGPWYSTPCLLCIYVDAFYQIMH